MKAAMCMYCALALTYKPEEGQSGVDRVVGEMRTHDLTCEKNPLVLQRAADKTAMQNALNYIRHVGANFTEKGQPHPQAWLVEQLEREIEAKPKS